MNGPGVGDLGVIGAVLVALRSFGGTVAAFMARRERRFERIERLLARLLERRGIPESDPPPPAREHERADTIRDDDTAPETPRSRAAARIKRASHALWRLPLEPEDDELD